MEYKWPKTEEFPKVKFVTSFKNVTFDLNLHIELMGATSY